MSDDSATAGELFDNRPAGGVSALRVWVSGVIVGATAHAVWRWLQR